MALLPVAVLLLPVVLTGCSKEGPAAEALEALQGVAEEMLSAHDPADLAIGKPAPEIIGANVDGEEMKLSDYLGKVVVIDFWGDW